MLLSLDTLRADRLRAYNGQARPHPTIDRLFDRGFTFSRAYSTAAWTLPAHVSMFTGLYPAHHGVVDSRYAIGDARSFVEALRNAGYETVGFTGGGFVGLQYGFNRGFAVYDGWHDGPSSVPTSVLPREGKRVADSQSAIFDRAAAFLKARNDTRPLFLFAHTYAVHDYFRDWEASGADGIHHPTTGLNAHLECLLGRRTCTSEQWLGFERAYEQEISTVDRALANLLDLVDAKLGLERTVIILVSDHGEGFDPGRHRIHHGGRLHQDQLHVPFVIAGPGVKSSRSNAVVSLVDLAPTVLEIAGVEAQSGFDGLSLVGALFGGARLPSRRAVQASEFAYFWKNGAREHVAEPPDRPILRAQIDEERWAIETTTGVVVYEADDLAQTVPLPEGARRPNVATGVAREPAKPARVQETMEVIEQLRALGYIQ